MTECSDRTCAQWLGVLLIASLTMCLGCRATSTSSPRVDAKVARYSEAGTESFAEGDGKAAIKSFRKALHRAWAIDDPFQSGTNAYNLAAALHDQGDATAAVEWLINARVDLARAGASAGNTYLLEAKIAREQGRLDDAIRLVSHAQCAPPPCGPPEVEPCDCESCTSRWLDHVPCGRDAREEKREQQRCRHDYLAQVYLAKAELAAEQYELAEAKQHLAAAIEIAVHVCSDDLRAEVRHTAALIDLAGGCYPQAARHLDREAALLRRAQNYRRIPEVLMLSATTYNEMMQFDESVDRLCRVARIWFARGELEKAWEVLQEALALGEAENSVSTRIRLKLTALEIEAAASEQQ